MRSDPTERNIILALARTAGDAATSENAEEALWHVTRIMPSLLGDASAATVPGNLPEGVQAQRAAAAFMRTPDGKHHLVTAPVNFQPEQYHELIPIGLGHPGHVAKTRRALLLRDTSHHQGFVKILHTFRAGSAVQVPMLWQDQYLGTVICASSVRNTFSEADLESAHAFAGLAAAIWTAHEGSKWLEALDYDALPEHRGGS